MQATKPLKLAIVTTGRADWGLLSPLAHKLSTYQNVEISVMAGNMHFIPELGSTWKEIEADGFNIAARVPATGNPAEVASASLIGFASAFAHILPDGVILLGDRYEILSVAIAATLAHIPVVHIAGGAVSEGAFDDSFRHAITKLSTLHLCETEEYRHRVIQLGEEPTRVFNTGAIGVQSVVNTPATSIEEFSDSLGFAIDRNTILCTMHAATLDPMPPERQFIEMLTAFDTIPERKILITYPNNDVNPKPLIHLLENYRRQNPKRICLVPSLGHHRYITALKTCAAMVGNSSSGIVEAPSAGIPVLDIGIRQQGRARAESVMHCNADNISIADGLQRVLSPEAVENAKKFPNPYYNPNSLEIMCNAILSFPWHEIHIKKFYNLQ